MYEQSFSTKRQILIQFFNEFLLQEEKLNLS